MTVLDKLPYAGRLENLHESSSDIRFLEGAIEDSAAVAEAGKEREAIVNLPPIRASLSRSPTGPGQSEGLTTGAKQLVPVANTRVLYCRCGTRGSAVQDGLPARSWA